MIASREKRDINTDTNTTEEFIYRYLVPGTRYTHVRKTRTHARKQKEKQTNDVVTKVTDVTKRVRLFILRCETDERSKLMKDPKELEDKQDVKDANATCKERTSHP